MLINGFDNFVSLISLSFQLAFGLLYPGKHLISLKKCLLPRDTIVKLYSQVTRVQVASISYAVVRT